MINNLRAFQEVLIRNNLPTPDTYLGISELIRSLYRPDVSPNPERIREVLEELTWPVTVPAGNPITFKSCSEVLASEAIVTFSPKQSGTGEPSPENIRPITGYDTLTLNVSHGEEQDDEHTTTFTDPVYSGSYNFVTGKLILDKLCVNIGSLDWAYLYGSSDNPLFRCENLPGAKIQARQINSIGYISVPSMTQTTTDNMAICIYSSSNVRIRNRSYTDVDTFKTAMSNIQLCYELDTPRVTTLTPDEITIYKVTNTVSTDGDTVQIKFQILK